MRRSIVALAVVAALVALAGCGGGGGSSADDDTSVDVAQYANSVCKALTSWRDQLTHASGVLVQRTNSIDDLREVRRQFVRFYNGAIVVTDDMLVAVGNAGVPDIENGERVATGVHGEVRRFRPIIVDARNAARKLPVDSEARFATQAQRLGTRFQIELNGLATMFQAIDERYGAPDLVQAADADAVCRKL